MNARGFRSMTVTLLLLGASVAIMAASATSRFQVTAHRMLTIAIVDSQRVTPARDQIYTRLAATLRAALNQTTGTEVHLRSVVVSAREAKQQLDGGNLDAALVIGVDRPLALRRLNFVTLAGALPGTAGAQSVYLIIADGDPLLNERLKTAFSHLLAKDRFYDRDVPQMLLPNLRSSGAKLATIDR